ncbi:methyltransferase domain-containing protein [Actinomadura sp. LD22]|uniref:Methyltransferase domain-containing protein n=1 Tax=Actinomadura physcomitrii TaxID=2650748 RepID=A0A6I4MFG2_9ACTN|nr:methyltransferase domain-containing protein [Actinomadura physcomitrii]MWA04958.1 methyltransferase domain-containing protein [Actinomadura physcomitrii]
MSPKGSVKPAIVRQFARPRGAAGHIAGWIMAHRGSNVQRNQWVVSLLEVQPGQRILEVGFGPGVALAETVRRVGATGHVYGIDRSEVMLRHASRRNAAAVRAGRITLVQAPVEALPAGFEGPFDAVYAVNSLEFWALPAERLAQLQRRLVPGGRLAIATQPRGADAARDPALAARERMEMFERAGLTGVRSHTLPLHPPVVCVIGAKGTGG